MNNNKKNLFMILFILFMGIGVVCFWLLNNKTMGTGEQSSQDVIQELPDIQSNNSATIESGNESEASEMNLEEYFQSNSDIIEELSIEESRNTLSETEVKQELDSRGFSEYPISADYDIKGNIVDETETTGSSAKHPAYFTYYYTDHDELWSIIVVDGQIMAMPVTYMMNTKTDIEIVVSESEVITSYDSNSNKFVKNIPDESIMKVIVIDKITAQALNELDIGGSLNE